MSETIYQRQITGLAIVIFLIGSLFYCYDYVVQIAPAAMVHHLMRDFSVNATELGVLSSSFYWTYTIMQIPGGLLLDRYGARLMLTLSLALFAIGTLIFAMAHSLLSAELGRILMGISGAFAFTGVIFLVIRWFPLASLAVFVGILQIFGCIGAVGGASFFSGLLTFFPWRSIMLVLAAVGFVISLINWVIIRDRPKGFVEHGAHGTMRQALRKVLNKGQTWWIGLYSFAIWGPIVTFAGLWGIPFLMASFQLSKMEAANGVSLLWIGLAAGSPLTGWLSAKLRRRCILLTIFAIIGLVAALGVLYMAHLSLTELYILLFLLGIGGGSQALAFGVVRDNNEVHTTGAANGFNNMAIVLGGIILQPLVGKLLDFGWHGQMMHGMRFYTVGNYRIALIVLPLCFLLAAITSIFFVRETHCVPADRK